MDSQISVLFYSELSKSILPSFTSFTINSPKREFCHANQARVKFVASSLWNDSCIKPVDASVAINIFMHSAISLSSVLVNAYIIILIGHSMSYPMCGPPIPSPAFPLKK